MVYQNNGSAAITVNSASLNFSPPANFISNLLGQSTPFSVAGNTADTLQFAITAASTITGDVTVEGKLSGVDENSEAMARDSLQTTFNLQTPADPIAWQGSTQPAVFDLDTTITFTVSLYNDGEADLYLDSTRTTLALLTTPYDSIGLSSSSSIKLAGGDSTTITFQGTNITGIAPADYAVRVRLVGTTTGQNYNNIIDAGQVTIGGDVFFAGGSVVPDVVVRGQSSVVVNMIVGNNGTPLPIDAAGTTVIFKKNGLDIVPQPTVIRTDTLTILDQVPDNHLTFVFDVPVTFPLDDIDVFGQISLDGGTLIKTSVEPIAVFNVFSGANLVYIPNSVSHSQVVPRQEVTFSMNIAEVDSSVLTLIPSLSYLEIDTLRAGLASNYIIPAKDSSVISFNPITIPSTMTVDTSYTFLAYLAGIQVNGDTLRDTLIVEPLELLIPATITIANINIIDDVVLQGQEDVGVEYTLRNDGQSPALARNILKRFSRIQDSLNVNNNWVLSSLTPELGNGNTARIVPGASLTFDALYVIGAQADTGMIAPHPQSTFSDELTLGFVDTSNTLSLFDSVRVIRPASLNIDSLILVVDALTPNKPNVNINEPFNLRLNLTNTGVDTAKDYSCDALTE